MSYIAEAVKAHWGERCTDFDADCKTCAAWSEFDTLESLQRENEELRKDKDHIAAEKAGIAKNAHNNVEYWKSQAEAAEAEVKRLRGEIAFYSCDSSTCDCISGQEDANSVTCGFRARTALASTGGEHHDN